MNQPARPSIADSRFRERLDLTKDPRHIHLKTQLAEARAERRRLRERVRALTASRDLWRHRALVKARKHG